MQYKKYFLLIKITSYSLIYFLIVSYYPFTQKLKTYNKNTIVIDLVHKEFDDDFFTDNDFYYTSLKLGSFVSYPKYSQYLKESYKGIPLNDSTAFYHSIDDRFLQSELFEHGDLSNEEKEWYLAHKYEDTLNVSKVKLKPTIIILIGFYKNTQFMIADANRNKDFGDDVKFEYDINFRKYPYLMIDFLNKQPVVEYTYEDCYKGNIHSYNRRFIIYPDRYNPYSDSYRNNNKKQREYFSILKFRDFWKGEITINNEEIEFYYHGYSNRYGLLYVKPKSVPYKRNSTSFDSQYSHKNYTNDKFNDTITIAGNRYKVDSINREISKLYMREVGKTKHFGHEVGSYIKNIEFKNLEEKQFKINDVINNKKYTLLEFWGTWCGPCLEMTPKLKRLQNNYSSILHIVSIAVDEDINSVKKYVAKHNLNWNFGYISSKRNSVNTNPIVKELNIKYFPTFILIDSNGKVISRGGTDSFEDVVNILKQ
jgi:thiol-disulfide isomerase/thioredoxin